MNDATLILRVDVDFPHLTQGAVLRISNRLAEAGLKAVFCVTIGSGARRGRVWRIGSRGYARRIMRLRPRGRLLYFVLRSLLSPPIVSPRLDVARRLAAGITAAGHHFALHGFDHQWWIENVWKASDELVRRQIDAAWEAGERIGLDPAQSGWASPGWKTSATVRRHLHARNLPYYTECWGRGPFIAADESGNSAGAVHLPVTDSVEAVTIAQGCSLQEAVARVLDQVQARGWGMLCMHDYFEGFIAPQVIGILLREMGQRDIVVPEPREYAVDLLKRRHALPVCRIGRGAVRGFAGEVSVQEAVISGSAQ